MFVIETGKPFVENNKRVLCITVRSNSAYVEMLLQLIKNIIGVNLLLFCQLVL